MRGVGRTTWDGIDLQAGLGWDGIHLQARLGWDGMGWDGICLQDERTELILVLLVDAYEDNRLRKAKRGGQNGRLAKMAVVS